MSHPDNAALNVIARSPFELYYDGVAEVVSAVNKVGEFDILPGHANFFSVLKPGQVVIEIGGDKEPVTIPVSSGIATVKDNQVMLFLNI